MALEPCSVTTAEVVHNSRPDAVDNTRHKEALTKTILSKGIYEYEEVVLNDEECREALTDLVIEYDYSGNPSPEAAVENHLLASSFIKAVIQAVEDSLTDDEVEDFKRSNTGE